MDKVIATIEMAYVLFKCGVVLLTGLAILRYYRAYRLLSQKRRADNNLYLRRTRA